MPTGEETCSSSDREGREMPGRTFIGLDPRERNGAEFETAGLSDGPFLRLRNGPSDNPAVSNSAPLRSLGSSPMKVRPGISRPSRSLLLHVSSPVGIVKVHLERSPILAFASGLSDLMYSVGDRFA